MSSLCRCQPWMIKSACQRVQRPPSTFLPRTFNTLRLHMISSSNRSSNSFQIDSRIGYSLMPFLIGLLRLPKRSKSLSFIFLFLLLLHLLFFLQQDVFVADAQEGRETSSENLTITPELGKFSSSVPYRSFEATRMHEDFYGQSASKVTDSERVARILHASKAVAIRTCPEYESEHLNKCEEILRKPVIPIGLLLPEKPEGRRITDKSWNENFEWLDGQKPKSVVFVGFGSECKLSKKQVHEIAYGLELSGLPFLWALRKPDWAIDDLDALPPGFNDRTRGRGTVCIGWAPQLEILGHPSIGGSLFHSGWGSIIETLQFGHCLVVLPLIIDQPLNARFLVEKGLAVEVERSDDGSFSGNGIAKALRLAMVSEEGENIRVRAKEAAEVFGNRKLQDVYFDRFVEYLGKERAATCN